MSNLDILTKGHSAIAFKKKGKQGHIKEILFDDEARRDFLTGFHKRKLAKADAARKKAQEREKQERLEARRDQRRQLREQAVENAAMVEGAYGALIGDSDSDPDADEWSGISDKALGKQKQQEYEDEEVLATVAVVEDFDPDSLIHGPRLKPSHVAPQPTPQMSALKKVWPKKVKPKSFRYQTKDDRNVEKRKQRARRTEKAELAGGRASRKTSRKKAVAGSKRH